MRLRRRLRLRKGRPAKGPAKSAEAPAQDEVLRGIPVDPTEEDQAFAHQSTLVEAQAVSDPLLKPPPTVKPQKQDETAEVAALKGRKADPNEETEGALDADLKEPVTPEKIGFHCSCGVKLMATRAAYDKRMRCVSCRTLMLVSLVWDPDKRAYEIVPFRVENLPDVKS